MKFLLVKVPKSNEYTYEQSQALFSSLHNYKGSSFVKKLLKKTERRFHYSYNIISHKQSIYFVVGTPEENIENLKNQLLAQYPKSDVIEISSFEEQFEMDYMKLSYSQMVLNSSDLIPIKTIDKFVEVDPLNSILSSMSRSQNPQDIFWIQMIISPAGQSWMSKASSKMSSLSAMETPTQKSQNEIAQIQEKLKHIGFNTNIRIITNNPPNTALLYSGYTVYTNPAGNMLKLAKPSKFGVNKFVKSVQSHQTYDKSFVLNTLELSSLWHMPNGTSNIPNIVWGKRLQLDAPDNLPIATETLTKEEKSEITFIGRTVYKNREHIFGLKAPDRLRHVYIVGKTGTGKSKLIVNMAIEDIRKGNGVGLLDPHGDAIEDVMNYIPKNRINDVCYFNPADPDFTYPLNLMEIDNDNQKELLVSGIIAIFYKLYAYSWGPRLEHILRNVLFTLVNVPGSTLPDVMKILYDEGYRNRVLKDINDPQILQFWRKEYASMGEKLLGEAIAPILNKVGQFVTSPMIRKIIQNPKSKVRINEIMDNKKIFLCDLSQGKIGEDNATLLGSMIITKIQIAAMNRAFLPESERVPFFLYVDEFQNFATSSFTKILSEARKYRLGLTLANQYITQIDEEVMGAILGNVGTISCFNVGAKDSEILHKEFGSDITPEDLTNLDKFQMLTRLAIDNRTSTPFTGYSLPLPKNISGHNLKIIDQSRKQFGLKLNKESYSNKHLNTDTNFNMIKNSNSNPNPNSNSNPNPSLNSTTATNTNSNSVSTSNAIKL